MANHVLVNLFEHKAWCDQGLVEALRAAPAGADRQTMSIALYTFDHISIVDRIFRARLMGEETAGFTGVVASARPVLDELERTLAETDRWLADYVRDVSAEALEEVVAFTYVADGEDGRMSRGQMLAHLITHGAAHRGAISQMLSGVGVEGPADMMTTFQRVRAGA